MPTVTTPQSKVMAAKNGFLHGYHAQAVANEDQVIVSAEGTDEKNDKAQLHPMNHQPVARPSGHRRATGKARADAGCA